MLTGCGCSSYKASDQSMSKHTSVSSQKGYADQESIKKPSSSVVEYSSVSWSCWQRVHSQSPGTEYSNGSQRGGHYLNTVPVWHYALTKAQIEQIDAVKKRAIHIVLNFFSWHAVHALCYLRQIYPLWPLVEKKCQGNSSFTFLNLLLAYITSSQTQEITRWFLGSGLTRNTLECSLALNVTAPLFSMR